jgi:hypothetical protein
MANSTLSNLAWFRLSEALIRNEREKAFIAYRLLSHSFICSGFKYQALADLHFSFGEMSLAFESYKQAFMVYYDNHDIFGMLIIINRLLWNIEGALYYIEKFFELIDSQDSLYSTHIENIIVTIENNYKINKKIDKNVKKVSHYSPNNINLLFEEIKNNKKISV